MIDQAEIEKRMGMKPINPLGTCFDSAARIFVFEPQTLPKLEVKLVHGIILTNAPGEEGHTAGHAWLENENHCYEIIWGVRVPKAKFYEDLKVSYTVSYTREEAFRLWLQADHSGPWDEKLIQVQKDLSKWPPLGLEDDPRYK